MKRPLFVFFAIAFSLVGVVVTPAGATTVINVATDHAWCKTNSGLVKFDTALHSGGAVPTTGKITGNLSGCSDTSNGLVQPFKAAYKVTFGAPDNDCASWFGTGGSESFSASSSTITWTPAAGQGFAPKTLVGTMLKNLQTAQPGIWHSDGAQWVSGSLGDSFNTYVFFYMLSGSITGEFAGGGASSLRGILQTDSGQLFAQCAAPAGVTKVAIGLGDYGS